MTGQPVDTPAAIVLLRIYYAATALFVVLDYAFGINLRLAFLDGQPGWRSLYYGVCFGCLAIMLWRPQWSAFVTAAESLLTMSLLIISMALRVMIVSDEMIESGRGAVTVEEIVNFGLAAGASYLAFLRSSRAAFSHARDRERF